MSQSEALNKTISHLYKTFSKYRAKRNFPPCLSQQDINGLFRVNLGNLTYEDFGLYEWKAMTTWGDVEDFKHFLPRIFEIMASDEYSFEPWLIGSKLKYGKFASWPSEEAEAVTRFFKILWSIRLSEWPPEACALTNIGQIKDYLQCFSAVYQDIQQFLNIWLHHNTIASLRHLVRFLIYHSGALVHKQPIFDDPSCLNGQEQIMRFLANGKMLKEMESAFFKYLDAPFSDELSEGVKKLEWIKSVYM